MLNALGLKAAGKQCVDVAARLDEAHAKEYAAILEVELCTGEFDSHGPYQSRLTCDSSNVEVGLGIRYTKRCKFCRWRSVASQAIGRGRHGSFARVHLPPTDGRFIGCPAWLTFPLTCLNDIP